jgi:hypothetical protein
MREFLMSLTYSEALEKVELHLGDANEERVKKAAVKAIGWILALQEDGYKIALVKDDKIEAIALDVIGFGK